MHKRLFPLTSNLRSIQPFIQEPTPQRTKLQPKIFKNKIILLQKRLNNHLLISRITKIGCKLHLFLQPISKPNMQRMISESQMKLFINKLLSPLLLMSQQQFLYQEGPNKVPPNLSQLHNHQLKFRKKSNKKLNLPKSNKYKSNKIH